MLILGIDPGSRKLGFALIESKGKEKIYLDSGVLNFENSLSFIDKIDLISKSVEELLEKYNPDEIAVESLIYVKNVDSLAKLAQARGAMLSCFVKTHKGKIFEYSPNLIKLAIANHGHASKKDISQILLMIFNGQKEKLNFKTDDESDALAVAVCHSFQKGISTSVQTGSLKSRTISSTLRHLG